MKRMNAIARIFGAALMVAGLAGAAEPPRREVGVARISSSAGDASKKHGARGDVAAAEAGLPLVAGDTLMTGPGGRMEVRLDESNFLRLGRDSEARLKQLGEKAFQVEVLRGTVSYSMLKHGEADVDLETPNANVVPRKDGIYRVTVVSAKESVVIVRKGEAEVLTPRGTVIAKKNKAVTVREAEARLADRAPAKDTFDEWAERRNSMLDRDRGPVYARGPWYPGPHIGVGWGWPYYDPFWYPYYGGFGPRVVVRAPLMVGRMGRGHRR